jgi:hypothetical protein
LKDLNVGGQIVLLGIQESGLQFFKIIGMDLIPDRLEVTNIGDGASEILEKLE